MFIGLFASIVAAQQTDPTRPFGDQATRYVGDKTPAFVLQSIMSKADNQTVVINGEIMKLGDKIKGFELISINPKGVILASSQRKMELSLFSGVVVKSQ
jgi:hypothetical protein